MEDFLQDKPKRKTNASARRTSYRRLFVLILAVAVLWQAALFVQGQVSKYHQALAQEVRLLLAVTEPTANEQLAAWGESLSAKKDIVSVKLFSPQDGLLALQARNPRLATAVVALGREQMPAYFEVRVQEHTLPNIELFTQNLAAEYPKLTVRYSPEQARMAYYSGVCVHILRLAMILAAVLFFVFMFLVEAYPVRGQTHTAAAVGYGALAGLVSLGIVALLIYPTGLLLPSLQQFTSPLQQAGVCVGCMLLGWTLSKWQKF